MSTPQQLSEIELKSLHATLDDEYKSFETYARVIDDFGEIGPFINIVQAEQRHYSALLGLFERYDVAPPENRWAGKAPRYTSVYEACIAAVAGEIENVALYDDALRSTIRGDILTVYQALRSASQDRHLPAFERCVKKGSRGR